MRDRDQVVKHLLDEIRPFVPRQPGTTATDTPIARLRVWSSTRPTPPTPALFQPMFYAVLQGSKILTLGKNRFELSAGDCAATSFGLPFVGHFANATQASPYIAICLELDVDLLSDVISRMPRAEDKWVCSATAGELEGGIGEVFSRFVALLSASDDIGVLSHVYERELYYRLLQSPMGETLRQLGHRDNRLRRIKAAADWLCANTEKPIVIAELAEKAGMSLTSFHRHFKAVTGHSPLAFQRKMRLLEARQLLVAGRMGVTQVAYAVGYVSPSQFSREYRAMFGAPPSADLRMTA